MNVEKIETQTALHVFAFVIAEIFQSQWNRPQQLYRGQQPRQVDLTQGWANYGQAMVHSSSLC